MSDSEKTARLIKILRVVVIMLGLALVGAVFWLIRQINPPTPSAFYTPPETLPDATPGTLLRAEPMPENLPDGAVAYRILYVSTGIHGEPVAVSGTVVAPAAASETPRPVVAWAHGTVGVLSQCGVSHSDDPYKQTPGVELMLAQGYVVVATDYIGLGTPGVHPYLLGPVSAYSVLDSVRAAQQLDVNAGSEFVVWGASQGGQASVWTAELAAEYAPDLTLIAAAASAPALDLAGIVEAKQDDKGGGVVLALAIYSWSYHYPEANINDIVQEAMRPQFIRIAETCMSTPLAYLTIGGLLTPNEYLIAPLNDTSPWREIIDENTPRGVLTVPLLITQGTEDTLIPIELNSAEAERRCNAGQDVEFLRLAGVGHDARDESAEVTIGWFVDRFAGRPTQTNCGP